jgi:hypothetical protein
MNTDYESATNAGWKKLIHRVHPGYVHAYMESLHTTNFVAWKMRVEISVTSIIPEQIRLSCVLANPPKNEKISLVYVNTSFIIFL